MIRSRFVAHGGLALILLVSTGCNLRAIMAEGQVDAARDLSRAGTEHWDPEMVGLYIPGALVQGEGGRLLVPDYEPLLLTLIGGYLAYGSGWVMEEAHAAEMEGDFDRAEKLQKRAGLLFDRALMHGKRVLRLRSKDFDEAVAGGADEFKRWVRYTFYEPERDAEVALHVATAWFATMSASSDGLAAAVDLPYARILMERSVELDPTLEGARGLWIMGTVECTMPELVGGQPKLGMELLERAAEITDRGNHSIMVTMAEKCAVALQDRQGFHRLLMEVVEAGDVAEFRMSNTLSRRRAGRLLANIDEFFF